MRITDVTRTLASLLGHVAGLLIVVALAATVYEVFMRYFLGAPTIWAHELTILLCAVAYLLSGGYTQERNGHIAIGLLQQRAGPGLRRVMSLAASIVSLAYFVLLAVAAHKRAWISLTTWEGTGTAWNPPIPAIVMPAIVVAAGVLAFQMLARLGRRNGGAR